MRILWVSHFLPYPPRGGNLQRSYNLLRVAARAHETHLVTLTQRAIHPSAEAVAAAAGSLAPLLASISTHDIPSDRSRLHWYSVVAGAFCSHRSYAESWFSQPTMTRAIERLKGGTLPFDLVHVDTIGLWRYTHPFLDTPIVLNHHNIESQLVERRAQREHRLAPKVYLTHEARKLRRLEASVCPVAATNLVVSALDADRLRAAAPGTQAAVVENGVDTTYFMPAPQESRPSELLFVASMGWYPNAEAARLLAATIWPALREALPSVRLTIVGPNPPRELTEAATRDERLTVAGFVEDVRPYFNRATAYLCPIQDGGGTRLKILDAMAMAKPIVATGLAVEGLDLVDGVHYLQAESPAAFVEQVSRLLNDPILRRSLADNARSLAEQRFAWAVVGRRLLAAYTAAARSPVENPTPPPGAPAPISDDLTETPR